MRIAVRIPLARVGLLVRHKCLATDRRRGGAVHPAVRPVPRPRDLRPERNRAGLRPVPAQGRDLRIVVGNRTGGRATTEGAARTSIEK